MAENKGAISFVHVETSFVFSLLLYTLGNQ